MFLRLNSAFCEPIVILARATRYVKTCFAPEYVALYISFKFFTFNLKTPLVHAFPEKYSTIYFLLYLATPPEVQVFSSVSWHAVPRLSAPVSF